MQKEDKEPSAPPPPYPGAPESGFQSVYPALPSNYSTFPAGQSAFPAGQSAFPAGYSTGQEVFAPPHPGYPVGPPQHPMPTGGYPQQQPGYIPLHPGVQSGGTAVVYQQPEVRVVAAGGSPPESFIGQIVTSCVATWCCFLPLGIIAFILALVAQSKAQSNRDEAHRIGIASYAMSALSVVVVIVIVLVIVFTS